MKPTPNNRFAKLFALARELGMSQDMLRAGAAQWSGQESLRTLNPRQLVEFELALETQKRKNYMQRRSAIARSFQENEFIIGDQRRYLIDLIACIFSGIDPFRKWLDGFLKVKTERFLDCEQATKVIKALSDMRKRGYRKCQGK